VVVLAIALAARCAGVFAGPSPAQESRTATVTPVDVLEVRTQVPPGVWPPGPADQPERPVQTDRLLAADVRVRANTSYRLERVVRIENCEDRGRTVIRRSRRVGAAGSVAEFLVATGTPPLQPTVRNSTSGTTTTPLRRGPVSPAAGPSPWRVSPGRRRETPPPAPSSDVTPSTSPETNRWPIPAVMCVGLPSISTTLFRPAPGSKPVIRQLTSSPVSGSTRFEPSSSAETSLSGWPSNDGVSLSVDVLPASILVYYI
jgi:hypothetical protein